MQYKIFPTNVRAMPLRCSAEEFVAEYYECWNDPKRKTGQLYELAMPFLEHWATMLNKPSSKKDLSYASMSRMLACKGDDPYEMIQSWVEQAKLKSSIKEELELLFFNRLRSLRYYPRAAAPKMAEYVIAKDFRDQLKAQVRTASVRSIDIPVPACTFSTMKVEAAHADHLLLKNIKFSPWEIYLLELIKLGMSPVEISTLTHLPRKTFSQEERYIWHKLKMKWQ